MDAPELDDDYCQDPVYCTKAYATKEEAREEAERWIAKARGTA